MRIRASFLIGLLLCAPAFAGYNPSNPNGQATMANSQPVVLASDWQLPSFASTPTFNIGTAPTFTVSGTFWPYTLGQKTMANSVPITFASDQSALAVTGTFWQATQPVSGTVTANAGSGTFAVSAASLPLPSGAATAANQATANTSLSTINTTLGSPMQNSGGSVTANIGTSGSLALASNQATAATVGSTTSGQTGKLAFGATTTSAPSYTTAQSNPLSLNTAGGLRVDGSGVTQPVSGTFWQATQPVSIATMPSTPVTGTFWQATQPVSLTSTTITGTVAATQSGTWTVQPGNTANTTAWKVDGSAVTQPVSGTVTANAGSGTMAVSAASLPLPSGAATAANQLPPLAQASATSGQTGALVQGAVTTAAPTYTTAQTNPLSLTTAGALRTDSSATTQPVSGTVTTTPPANASTNLAQVAGTTSDTNSGNKSAGTLRVVLATDQPALSNKLLVTPDSVALPANQSVNVNQIAGASVNTGNGTASGSQRVTIASDSTGQIALAGTLPAFAATPAVTVSAASSGGWSAYSANVTNTAVAVEASAGQIGWYFVGNQNAAICYLQVFNVAAASVTVGTTTPAYSWPVVAFGGANASIPGGLAFGTAISIAATTTRTGSTACTSGLDVNLAIKP